MMVFSQRLVWSRFALVVLSLALAAAGGADPFKLKILLNGSPAGEASYEAGPAGAFTSKSDLHLGSLVESTDITGHVVGGKITDYELEGTLPGVPKIKMTLSKGTFTVVAGGKSRSAPFEDRTGLLIGALHPQFAASTLLAAEKALSSNTGSPIASFSALFLEAGTVLPLTVRSLPARKLLVKGQPEDVRRFSVHVASLDIEYALDEANRVVAVDVPAQKLRLIADGWDGLFIDPLSKYPELSQPIYKVVTEVGVAMKTRDGVSLVCDIVRPDDKAKHPTILTRTPYGRGGAALDAPFWARRGYCYVSQDCRGREDSGGDWNPFVNEGPDGYDTIQWIAAQPWSDGKVGMIGGSYGGYVQWASAVLNPPALKCIVPQVSPPDAMHNLPYEFGTFALYADLWWSNIVAEKKTNLQGTEVKLEHPDKLTTLPLKDVDKAVLGKHLPFFSQWLSNDTMSKWKGFDFTSFIANARVPALHISGNWDGDGIGTFLNWDAMRKLGRTDQWIIFGPWIHAFNTTHSMGDVEYGPNAILELDSVYLRWFDTWLKGKHVGQSAVPHVKLFVTGANKWIEAPQWPSAQMKERTLYLGKGTLSLAKGKLTPVKYTYDPAKDVKIPQALRSGAVGEGDTRIPASALHEKTAELFTTKPFAKATAITGPYSIQLHFKTSAQNTDFYCSLMDLDAKGDAHVLGVAGKIRGSYLGGMGQIRALIPGKEYVASITPWEFAHEFAPGHRLALMVRSSVFPMFARNLGTIDPIKTATRMVVQNNSILLGTGHASSLSFHVLWEK